MSDTKPRVRVTEADDLTTVKATKDPDGQEWLVEKEGKGVRVHLRTKDGRALNAYGTDEAALKAQILAAL